MTVILDQAKTGLATIKRGAVTVSDWLIAEGEPVAPEEIIGFLSPIDQVCLTPAPRYTRSTLYVIVGLFLSVVTIAGLVKVDQIVVGTGRIVTETAPILGQSFDRAIIRDIRVHPGDHVTKGQTLAVLDPTFARADFESLATQRQNLQAESDRLDAEADHRPYAPGDHPNSAETLQATLYLQRQANYTSRIQVFDQDLNRLRADQSTAEKDAKIGDEELAAAREVEAMRKSTFESQTGSRLNFLDAQVTRMRTQRALDESVNRAKELIYQIQSREAERQAFIEEWRRQILESQATIRTQLATINENVRKASLVNDMVLLTASTDGTVLDVAPRSVGSVLREAEPLFTIVPADAKLYADIEINSSDVGSVKKGDEVLMKIDAFPYNHHGSAHGTLLSISEENVGSNSLTGQTVPTAAGTLHRGRVELTDVALRNMPEGAHLIPGMALQAEIKVGSRSLLGYFLSPVTRGFDEALREP